MRCILLAISVLTACAQAHPETAIADTEGRQTGLPPVYSPNRVADLELRSRGRGRLIVQVEGSGGIDKAEVRLLETRTSPERTGITDTNGTAIIDTVVPGEYIGIVRRIGMQQQSFRIRLTAGYADTLRISFGWSP